MVRYRIIDHTADIGIEVYGESLSDLFKNSAFALFDIIADIKDIKEDIELNIDLEGFNLEELMVDWLSELLYLSQTKGYIFKETYIEEITDRHLKARAKGEVFNPKAHMFKIEIKGVTYHMLEVNRRKNYWFARIIFDI
jgi:SHS2 domain-containing protein